MKKRYILIILFIIMGISLIYGILIFLKNLLFLIGDFIGKLLGIST